MKCKFCGAESGKYPLCWTCKQKKENGEIKKCDVCGKWYSALSTCPHSHTAHNSENYLYDAKKVLISKSEQEYYSAIKECIPQGYYIFPQVNLASFICKTDESKFHNELFRNVDFLITTSAYKPIIVVEINDQTHLNSDRKERDEKVQNICEEAGIPILKFWTSYGVNKEYIKRRIDETIISLPIDRVHHFKSKPLEELNQTNNPQNNSNNRRKSGCYVATCVYGSYDCPEVWVLRRYRDQVLSSTWYGRLFVKIYYAVSPTIVQVFGKKKWFNNLFKNILDPTVIKLCNRGFESTPYLDL